MTGRLMVLAWASMIFLALSLSVTPAWRAASSFRQVVPLRLSRVSQPRAVSQVSNCASGTPCFLKS